VLLIPNTLTRHAADSIPAVTSPRITTCSVSLIFALGELEETTRTPSYYVDEDYPAGPEIQKPPLNEAIVVAQNRPLRLALGTPSGACHERSYIQKFCDNSFLDKLDDAKDHARQMEWSNRPGRVWRRFLATFDVSFPDTVHHVVAS